MKQIDTFLNRFNETVKRIRMQPRVRDVIRERLIAYADMHAVKEAREKAAQVSIWAQMHMSVLRVGAALLVIAIGTGGLAYASEDTLPGDALYSVKIGFIEPLESAMLVAPKSRATWSAILAERRLVEAARLEVAGELTEPTRMYLEDQFALHTARTDASVDEVRASGDVVAAFALHSDLEARLSAHENIFGLLGEYDEEGNPRNEAAKLHERVALAREIATAERMRVEEEASARALAYGTVNIELAAQITEDVARAALKEGEDAAGAIEERLQAARGAIAIARVALAENEDAGAFVAAQTAGRLTQEAGILSKNRDLVAAGDARARARVPVHAKVPGAPDQGTVMLSVPASASITATSSEGEEESHTPSKEQPSEDASSQEPQKEEANKTIEIDIGPFHIGL